MFAYGPPYQHSGLHAFKPIIDGIENDAIPGSVCQERVAAPHPDAGRGLQLAVSGAGDVNLAPIRVRIVDEQVPEAAHYVFF
jgi:hypothetical protein